MFHAFSRVVNEARSAFVVLDTAPTGHSLLLMDATGAFMPGITITSVPIGGMNGTSMRFCIRQEAPG